MLLSGLTEDISVWCEPNNRSICAATSQSNPWNNFHVIWYQTLQTRVTAQHLNDNNIQSLPWGFKSPGLKAIEHIWDALDNKDPRRTPNCIAWRSGELFTVWDNVIKHPSLPRVAIRDIEMWIYWIVIIKSFINMFPYSCINILNCIALKDLNRYNLLFIATWCNNHRVEDLTKSWKVRGVTIISKYP